MSITVMIPNIGSNPYVVEINGVRYAYPAGTQQTVPDAVAAVIANDVLLQPKEDPNAEDKLFATVEKVKALIAASGGGGDGGFTVVYDGETVDKTPDEILEAAESQPVTLVVTGEDGGAEQYMLIEAGTDKDDNAYAEFARCYETKDGVGMEIYTYDDDGIDNAIYALALASAIPESPVMRIPFTLSYDEQTGVTGTTDADFANTLAARANGKIIVCDAVLEMGGTTQYFCGVMSGASAGDASALTAVVIMPDVSNNLIAYTIAWTASGVNVGTKTITTT